MRLLKANEIECRVGQQTKDKSKYSVLLYKTARCDMAILDEEYGAYNWQVKYDMVGSQMFCTIYIWDAGKGQWVAKQSNGSESNIEAEKGQASDAFKRAGFMLGIGRELYTAPKIWLSSDISSYDLEVAEIGYNDNREINRLVIKAKGQIVYELGKYIKAEPKTEPKPVSVPTTPVAEPTTKDYYNELVRLCPDADRLREICSMNGVKSSKDLTKFKFEAIKRAIANEKTADDSQG